MPTRATAKATSATATATSRLRSEKRFTSPGCPQHVADAADGVDEVRLDRVDLLAEVADVQLDDVGPALEVVLPHPFQDLRLGQHHPLVAHQVAQQLELGRRQLHLPAGP